jgi:hypothetical protein
MQTSVVGKAGRNLRRRMVIGANAKGEPAGVGYTD